jgi:protein required for attachment to host cells
MAMALHEAGARCRKSYRPAARRHLAGAAGEDKLDHEAELFARRVAGRLAEAHRAHRYGELRIAAAPRFLGRLRKALDPEVAKSVTGEIDKDLLQLDRRELTQKLFPPPANA